MLYLQRPENIKLFMYNISKANELTKGAELVMNLFSHLLTLYSTNKLLNVIIIVLDFIKHYPSTTTYKAILLYHIFYLNKLKLNKNFPLY